MLPALLPFLLTVSALAQDPYEARAGFEILIPQYLAHDNEATSWKAPYAQGMEHAEALFGTPEYGGDLTGPVFYATPGATETGCSAYAQDDRTKEWQAAQQYILLVDRGDCHFVKKVRYAEDVGAMAVIIVDNQCLAGDPTETCDHGLEAPGGCPASHAKVTSLDCAATAESRLPFMADDGSGGNIRIPSYLVSKYDGQVLKDTLYNKQKDDFSGTLIVRLKWELPEADGQVRYSLWTSSEDWNGADFKREFAPAASALAETAIFDPRYFIYDGKWWGCLDSGSCGSQCTNNGRYCEPDPDGSSVNDLGVGLSGAHVIQENLRQLCIWRTVNVTTAGQAKWWGYADSFAESCFGVDGVETGETFKACSEDQMRRWGIDQAAVEKCVADSGGTDDCPDAPASGGGCRNTILDRELSDRGSLNIIMLPSIIVNGVVERGGVTYGPVLKTICAGFKDGTAPSPICDYALSPMGGTGHHSVFFDCVLHGLDATELTAELTSEFRSEIGYKAGVDKLYVLVAAINGRDVSGGDGRRRLMGPHSSVKLTVELTDLAKAEADLAVKSLQGADISFHTEEDSAQGKESIKVQVVLDSASLKVLAAGGAGAGAGAGGVSGGTVAAIVIVLLLSFAAGGFVYWRRTQQQMREQVRNILAEYMPLDDMGGKSEADTARLTQI